MEGENNNNKRPLLTRQKDSTNSIDDENPASPTEEDSVGQFEESSDDEDTDLFVNPSGSVLRPSGFPYDKQKRLMEANLALSEMDERTSPPNARVRFSENVATIQLFEESLPSVDEPPPDNDEKTENSENSEAQNKEDEGDDNKGTIEAEQPRQLVVSLYPDPRTSVDLPSEGSETEEELYSDNTNCRDNVLHGGDDTPRSEISEEIEEEEDTVQEMLAPCEEDLEDLASSLDRTLSIGEGSAEAEETFESAKMKMEVEPAPPSRPPRRVPRPASSRPRARTTPPSWKRPWTAPPDRSAHPHKACTAWKPELLPQYNGFRSEYGLTAEQLQERRRMKTERGKTLRLKRTQRSAEEDRKRYENNLMFSSWLAKKRKEANEKLLACARLANSNNKFKTQLAPTSHLEKTGALRKTALRRQPSYTAIQDFFNSSSAKEQKTYRIYLGLSVE